MATTEEKVLNRILMPAITAVGAVMLSMIGWYLVDGVNIPDRAEVQTMIDIAVKNTEYSKDRQYIMSSLQNSAQSLHNSNEIMTSLKIEIAVLNNQVERLTKVLDKNNLGEIANE